MVFENGRLLRYNILQSEKITKIKVKMIIVVGKDQVKNKSKKIGEKK